MIWSTALSVVGVVTLAATAAVAGEIAARAWFRRRPYYVYRPNTGHVFLPDPTLYPQLEPEVHHRYNADGERGEAVPRTGRVFRVLAAGDSTTECYHVDQATSWPGTLQRILSRPDSLRVLNADHVHVGSIGRSGADSASLQRMLTGVLPNYAHLDAVVLMAGVSDVLRWLEIGAPADRQPDPLPADECFQRSPETVFGLHPRRTASAEVLRRVLDRIRPPGPEVGRGRWMARARAERAAAREIRRDVPDMRALLDRFDANLRAIIALCRTAAPLVVVVRPPWFEKASFTPEEESLFWCGGVGQAYREPISVFYSSEVLFALFRGIDERCVAVGESVGAPVVDVRGVLEMNARDFFDHVHVTAPGSARIAGAVADAIRAAVARNTPGISAATRPPIRDAAPVG